MLHSDVYKIIARFLPYADKVQLRGVSQGFKTMVEQISTLPLLNTATVYNAKTYIRENDHHPERVGIDKIQFNTVSFHPSKDSLDSLIMRFTSKWYDDTENGWGPCEPPTDELFAVSKVFSLAARKGNHQYEYQSLDTRDLRHNFICIYLNLPNTTTHLRWKNLCGQTIESLERLKQSLNNYTAVQFKALLTEVDEAIQEKAKNTNNNIQTSLDLGEAPSERSPRSAL